jgi:hypothetical protein
MKTEGGVMGEILKVGQRLDRGYIEVKVTQ